MRARVEVPDRKGRRRGGQNEERKKEKGNDRERVKEEEEKGKKARKEGERVVLGLGAVNAARRGSANLDEELLMALLLLPQEMFRGVLPSCGLMNRRSECRCLQASILVRLLSPRCFRRAHTVVVDVAATAAAAADPWAATILVYRP